MWPESTQHLQKNKPEHDEQCNSGEKFAGTRSPDVDDWLVGAVLKHMRRESRQSRSSCPARGEEAKIERLYRPRRMSFEFADLASGEIFQTKLPSLHVAELTRSHVDYSTGSCARGPFFNFCSEKTAFSLSRNDVDTRYRRRKHVFEEDRPHHL